jgi:selenocysteine lyase/cysteine desulfurase
MEAHHTKLVARLLERLRAIEGVTIHGPQTTADRTSVVSITVDGYDPQEIAAMLEASHRIQCRAGLHCAPRMHESLGTSAGGGTVRLSPGYATALEQIEIVAGAVEEIATSAQVLRTS